MHPRAGVRAGREAAVRARDNVLPADEVGVLHDALGHQLRMLHELGHGIDDAGHEDLALRQLDVLPDGPFVAVARVRRLHAVALRLDLQDEIDDVPQRDVIDVRRFAVTPADMA